MYLSDLDKNEEIDRALENVSSTQLQSSDGMRQRAVSVTEPVSRLVERERLNTPFYIVFGDFS